jgi:hypothetical protein
MVESILAAIKLIAALLRQPEPFLLPSLDLLG